MHLQYVHLYTSLPILSWLGIIHTIVRVAVQAWMKHRAIFLSCSS